MGRAEGVLIMPADIRLLFNDEPLFYWMRIEFRLPLSF